jgi:hypothetical protein
MIADGDKEILDKEEGEGADLEAVLFLILPRAEIQIDEQRRNDARRSTGW